MLIVVLTCSTLCESADVSLVWDGSKQPYQEFVTGCKNVQRSGQPKSLYSLSSCLMRRNTKDCVVDMMNAALSSLSVLGERIFFLLQK